MFLERHERHERHNNSPIRKKNTIEKLQDIIYKQNKKIYILKKIITVETLYIIYLFVRLCNDKNYQQLY